MLRCSFIKSFLASRHWLNHFNPVKSIMHNELILPDVPELHFSGSLMITVLNFFHRINWKDFTSWLLWVYNINIISRQTYLELINVFRLFRMKVGQFYNALQKIALSEALFCIFGYVSGSFHQLLGRKRIHWAFNNVKLEET